MDEQEYLNQISAENRPVKKSRAGGLFSSKIFMAIGIGVAALILIIIIGSILGSGKDDEKNLATTLKLHLSNTTEIIDKYQPEVKSSDLRSSSASLKGVLTNTDKDLTAFLTEVYEYNEKKVDQKILDEITLEKDGLESELFEAKINGILDRIYAHKMAYEVSMFLSEESDLMNLTKNEALKEALSSSYNSLENLYNSFNDFSETK